MTAPTTTRIRRRALPRFDDPAVERTFQGCSALVVLPTRNEERGLERTLAAIPEEFRHGAGSSVRTVVIDGGSTDGTLEVARRAGIPLLHQQGRGKGEALTEVIAWARQQKIPHVLVLDADATYSPDRIAPALALLRAGTDLVIGVRRPVWGAPRHPIELVHRAGNILLSWTASLLARRAILDVCSGFWGVSTERFTDLRVGDSQFAIEAELVMKSLRAGLRVNQIPIAYRDRVGESKLHTWSDGGAIFLTILRFGRMRRGPRIEVAPGPTRLRDLLSIGAITGTSGAVVTCAPTELRHAQELAAALRRGLPEATIEVQTTSRAHPSTGPVRARLLIRLPPDPSAGPPNRVTVAVHPREHSLRIHLPAPSRVSYRGPIGPPPALRESPDPSSSWSARFAVVISRLNYDPVAQQRSMFFANGLSVDDEIRSLGSAGGRDGVPW
jgi:Glycosyl transferase family 2